MRCASKVGGKIPQLGAIGHSPTSKEKATGTSVMTGNGGSFGSSAVGNEASCEYCRHSCSLNHMPLARPLSIRDQPFFNSASRRGLQLNLRPKLVAEKAFGGLPARNRTAMVGDLKCEAASNSWFSILVSFQIAGKEMLRPLQSLTKTNLG